MVKPYELRRGVSTLVATNEKAFSTHLGSETVRKSSDGFGSNLDGPKLTTDRLDGPDVKGFICELHRGVRGAGEGGEQF